MIYTHLLQSRKSSEWSPAPLAKTPIKPNGGIPDTIAKIQAIALHLELPVGAFVGDTTRKGLPISNDALALLKSNIADETRHERAFKYSAEVYPVSGDYLHTASNIAEDWISHPAHTLAKAAVLELGVFMLGLDFLLRFGSQSLGRVAYDVSKDENRHVQTNFAIIDELNLSIDSSLNSLRKQTLSWIMEDVSIPGMGVDFWLRQSQQYMDTRQAPELGRRNARMPAFFEQNNRYVSAYI